jgi:hypothetical protein
MSESFSFKPSNDDGFGELIVQFFNGVLLNLSISPNGRSVVFRYQQNNPFPNNILSQRNVAIQFELPTEQFLLQLTEGHVPVSSDGVSVTGFNTQVNQTLLQIGYHPNTDTVDFVLYPNFELVASTLIVSVPHRDMMEKMGFEAAVRLMLRDGYENDPDLLMRSLIAATIQEESSQ